MAFCTAVNCMDGRVQLPVIHYLAERFNVEYVDSITDPGPNLILARRSDKGIVDSIERRVSISVNKHKSIGIAVVGHHDCAGNPSQPSEQIEQTLESVRYLQEKFPDVPVIGLWVDELWSVSEINADLLIPAG